MAHSGAAHRWLARLLALGLVGFAALILIGLARRNPQSMPWTPLDLTQPVGMFTGRKLAALRDDPARCRALLGAAGILFYDIARTSWNSRLRVRLL